MSLHRLRYVALAVLLSVSLIACDSGGDDGDPPVEALNAMFVNVQGALTTALTAATGPVMSIAAEKQRPVVDCPQGGTADVTSEEVGSNGFELVAEFDDCNGIDGNLVMTTSATFEGQQIVTNVVIGGELRERCTIEYDDFRQTIITNVQSSTESTLVMNGSFGAVCREGSVQCVFEDDVFDLDEGGNQSLFENNCG